MELGHILRPSDPGIQQPGDPVDPVILFCNELQMPTNVADKRLQWARSLPVFIAVWRLHTSGKENFEDRVKCQYFNDGWTDFHKKYLSLYLHLGLFSKTGKTRVSHRVKMTTR